MKFIIGLGNPGRLYSKTRHNLGFNVLDRYATLNTDNIWKEKKNALYMESKIDGENIILIKPQKYMNLSGEVLKAFVDFYKIKTEDILVIHDDLDLPCGHIRLKTSGGSAGHNGLKDITQHLNTDEYKRLRIGISNDKAQDTKDFVLGKFNKEEKKLIESAIENSCEIINDYLKMNFEELQNKYN